MATYFPEEYVSRIREGRISPIVLFMGEEQLLADEAISLITATVVEESMRDFNADVLDGSRATLEDVLARASAFPMMAEKRLVVVRRFERLVANDAGRDMFQPYVSQPSVSTVLVLSVDKADLRKRPYPEIKKKYDVVDCKPLPEREVPGWIQGRVRQLGKSMDAEAAFLLQSYVGNSLHAVLRELEKLATFVGDRAEITVDDVTSAVGATRGFTIFNLQDAIGKKDYRQAVGIVRRMLLYGEQAPLIIANVTRYFIQLLAVRECLAKRMTQNQVAEAVHLHPYRAKLMMPVARTFTPEEMVNALHVLRVADRTLKSSDVDPVATVELLLHEIIRGTTMQPQPGPAANG